MRTSKNTNPLNLLLDELSISIDSTEETPSVEVFLDTDTEVLTTIATELAANEFTFEESIVKDNLEEILLLLIGFRGATHGKELMGDLSNLFNAHLSPGTVYPALHELEDENVLEMHKLVRTKEYTINDEDVARERIEEAMRQHLAIGLFLYGSLKNI